MCTVTYANLWKEACERKINITLYNSVMMNLRADGQGIATNYHNCVLVIEGLLEGVEEFLFPLKPVGYELNLLKQSSVIMTIKDQ